MSKVLDLASELEAITGGNDEQSTVSMFLDTGFPPLNYALSSRYDGGFPVGRIVEMFGPPSSGKTAISTEAMIAAQKQGGIAGFFDHERSFDMDLAIKAGLDPKRFIFKKPRTFEDALDQAVNFAQKIRKGKLIEPSAPICFIFDSLASMVPHSKLFDKDGKEREAGSYGMHDNMALAKATSAAFPAFNQFVEELGICAVFLNQMRIKPGVTYGDPTTTPGGDAPKFYASVRVQLGRKMITKGSGDDRVVLGQEIGCKVVKNKVSRPFLTAAWRFMFNDDGTGKFDVIGSMVEFLIANKMLEQAGAYIVWIDGKKYHKGPLVEKIEREGLKEELFKLLPKTEEPVVVLPAEEEEAA